MYEKIKTVIFNEVEVTIYKNMSDEYFAEYSNGYHTEKIPCGKDYFGIWQVLADIFNTDEAPQGADILRIADQVEAAVGIDTTRIIIEDTMQRMMKEDEILWSASARDAAMYVVESRFGRIAHDTGVRIKLRCMAPLDEWLMDAITSKRVYRLTTPDEYDEQPVRIVGAYATDNDYLMEFAILDLTEDDDGNAAILSSEVFYKPMSACTLSHYREDELPAEYQESSEWD